jgi:hypothetical protein
MQVNGIAAVGRPRYLASLSAALREALTTSGPAFARVASCFQDHLGVVLTDAQLEAIRAGVARGARAIVARLTDERIVELSKQVDEIVFPATLVSSVKPIAVELVCAARKAMAECLESHTATTSG